MYGFALEEVTTSNDGTVKRHVLHGRDAFAARVQSADIRVYQPGWITAREHDLLGRRVSPRR